MKHRVKVEYTVDIECGSQASAIREAAYAVPSGGTGNVKIECWTPKPKLMDDVGKVAEPRPELMQVAEPERSDFPLPAI